MSLFGSRVSNTREQLLETLSLPNVQGQNRKVWLHIFQYLYEALSPENINREPYDRLSKVIAEEASGSIYGTIEGCSGRQHSSNDAPIPSGTYTRKHVQDARTVTISISAGVRGAASHLNFSNYSLDSPNSLPGDTGNIRDLTDQPLLVLRYLAEACGMRKMHSNSLIGIITNDLLLAPAAGRYDAEILHNRNHKGDGSSVEKWTQHLTINVQDAPRLREMVEQCIKVLQGEVNDIGKPSSSLAQGSTSGASR